MNIPSPVNIIQQSVKLNRVLKMELFFLHIHQIKPHSISCLNREEIVVRQNNSELLCMEEDSVLSTSSIPIT